MYAFDSLLAASCWGTRNWEVVQQLPAHGWEKRYRYGWRSNRKYGMGHLARDLQAGCDHDAQAGWAGPVAGVGVREKRDRAGSEAKGKVRMEPKLERYRNYYSSPDTAGDFPDGRPGVLFVFDRREDASRFAVYAARDGRRKLPMLVSSLEDLSGTAGIFGRSWLIPWRLESGQQTLGALMA